MRLGFCASLAFITSAFTLPSARSPQSYFSSNTDGDDGAFSSPFLIKKVESRELFYNVSVFRYRNIPFNEFQQQNDHLSRAEALMALTGTKCNDKGQDLWFSCESRGFLTQFAAILKEKDDCQEQLGIPNTVIGATDAHLHYFPSNGSSKIELKNIHVHPSFRRKGVASSLVKAAQEYARTLNPAPSVYLHTDVNNLGARALYNSRGFENDPFDAEKMVWKIDFSRNVSLE